jgi:hypothetical protein
VGFERKQRWREDGKRESWAESFMEEENEQRQRDRELEREVSEKWVL